MAEKDLSETSPCLAAAILDPIGACSSRGANNVARIQRNVAEKQRRDKLNGFISELANIVPMVSMSSKRLDKTSILRLAAAHLRLCKSPLNGNRKMKRSFKGYPSFMSEEQIRGILESVDGFLLLTTSTGKVLFTSHSVERYLGHQDIDLIGHSLFMFIHPDDVDVVKDEIEKLLLASLDYGTRRCSFRCRMREKAQPRSEVVTYQYVHFVGAMTVTEEDAEEKSKLVVTQMFKAFVKVVDVSPYNQLSLEEATADEYVTRHSLDGTIIFADHRLATITGHMPHEVVGFNAYKYIHAEDTPIALFAHHLMFSNDKGTGMIVYRLRTRDEKYVYLKSVGCLQFDGATSQVDHFVCVNQQLSNSEGDQQLKYFIERFIPHIKGSSTTSLFESVKALQASGTKTTPAPREPFQPENGTAPSDTASSAFSDSESNQCVDSVGESIQCVDSESRDGFHRSADADSRSSVCQLSHSQIQGTNQDSECILGSYHGTCEGSIRRLVPVESLNQSIHVHRSSDSSKVSCEGSVRSLADSPLSNSMDSDLMLDDDVIYRDVEVTSCERSRSVFGSSAGSPLLAHSKWSPADHLKGAAAKLDFAEDGSACSSAPLEYCEDMPTAFDEVGPDSRGLTFQEDLSLLGGSLTSVDGLCNGSANVWNLRPSYAGSLETEDRLENDQLTLDDSKYDIW